MVLNPGKCCYMLTKDHDEPDKINLNGTEISSSNNEKLFDVLFDKSLCKKAGQNLSALAGISSYLILDQKLLLTNPVIKSQFN